MNENREKLPESEVKPVEEAVAAAKSALAGGILEQIQSATLKLESASHKLAEVLYKAGGGQAGAAGAGAGEPGPGAPQSGAGAGKPDDVIDAEYVDVEENKKPN